MPIPASLPLLNGITFYFFAGLIVLSALGVVFHRSIVYSALFLLLCFLSIAGFFVTLNAPFIAAAEILVYAVGLTIVLIFGVMLTGDIPPETLPGAIKVSPLNRVFAVVGTLLMIDLLLAGIFNFAYLQLGPLPGPLLNVPERTAAMISLLPGAQAIMTDGGVTHIGLLLFNQYAVPFELASVLLLLAMVGAILLSKRTYPEEEGSLESLLPADFDSPREFEDSETSPPQLVGAQH